MKIGQLQNIGRVIGAPLPWSVMNLQFKHVVVGQRLTPASFPKKLKVTEWWKHRQERKEDNKHTWQLVSPCSPNNKNNSQLYSVEIGILWWIAPNYKSMKKAIFEVGWEQSLIVNNELFRKRTCSLVSVQKYFSTRWKKMIQFLCRPCSPYHSGCEP